MATKIWKKEISDDNVALLKDYATRSFHWRYNSSLLENARYGKIYSKEEYSQMIALRIAPVTLNIATAIIETAEALALNIKPTPKVAPLMFPFNPTKQENSKKIAQLYEFLITKDFQESFGSLQLDRIVRDQSNTGRGTAQIIPVFENGEFYTKFVRLPWRYYLPDPASIDEFYQDADAHIYAFPMSKKSALRYLRTKIPNFEAKDLDDFVKGSVVDSMSIFNDDDKYFLGKRREDVMFINRMSLEDQKIYKIIPKRPANDTREAELVAQLRSRMITDEEDYYLQEAVKLDLVDYKSEIEEVLTHHISVGNLGFVETFPLKTVPVVSLQYDAKDNAFPQGRMQPLYSPLRVMNKFFMTALLNASLLNATRVLAEEDSIVNEDQVVMSSSVPGAVIKYRLPIPGVSKPPEVIRAMPLDRGWLDLPRFLIQIMEYISFGVMTSNEQPAVGQTTVASLQSTGVSKVRRRLNDVDIFLSRVGKIQAEFYQNYAPLMGFRSYIDDSTGNYDVKLFNKLNLLKEEGKYKTEIDPATDLSFGVKDVIFSSKSTSGYETANLINSMTTLATQLQVPELVPVILQMHNLPNTEEVIQKVSIRNDVLAENQALRTQLSKLERQANIYQNQIFQLIQSVERARAKGKADVILKELDNIVKSIKENQNGG